MSNIFASATTTIPPIIAKKTLAARLPEDESGRPQPGQTRSLGLNSSPQSEQCLVILYGLIEKTAEPQRTHWDKSLDFDYENRNAKFRKLFKK